MGKWLPKNIAMHITTNSLKGIKLSILNMFETKEFTNSNIDSREIIRDLSENH